jgi:hypothetical protein
MRGRSKSAHALRPYEIYCAHWPQGYIEDLQTNLQRLHYVVSILTAWLNGQLTSQFTHFTCDICYEADCITFVQNFVNLGRTVYKFIIIYVCVRMQGKIMT